MALAWATEAMEKGLISEAETDGVALRFGDAGAYIEATQRIVSQPTDFYRALAHGVDHAAAIYGGEDFALAFGGNEMPGYHTGPACHLGYLTGARHSHLDSAGYGLDQAAARAGEQLDPIEVVEALVKEEQWRQVLTSLVICLFARKVYDPGIVLQALGTMGREWSEEALVALGVDVLRRKVAFKRREGFDATGLRVPARITETPSPAGPFDDVFIRKALAHYDTLV